MRVLITRPREEAESLAAQLAARGIDSLVEPLLDIRPITTPALALDGVQALLFTSANGARAFAAREGRRDLPVFAVGARTAEVAREAGFTRVESAADDVTRLAALVRERLDPARGAILHGSGAVIKGDIAALLAPAGFAVRRVALYEATPAGELSATARADIQRGAIAAVLLFSARTAETFVSLAQRAGLTAALSRIAAVCLSRAVADAVAPVAWREVLVAARPEQGALLALLGKQDSRAAELGESSEKPEPSRVPETEGPVVRAIAAFGGIRPMAAKLGVPVTTVQGWKARGNIPEARRTEVLEAARKHGIPLSEGELGEAPAPTAAAAAPAAPATPAEKTAADAETATPPALAAPAALAGAANDEPAKRLEVPASAAGSGSQANDSAPWRTEAGAGSPASDRWRPSRMVFGLWLMALAVFALAAAASLPYWAPLVGLGRGNGDATALGARLDTLGSRLAALESRSPAPSSEGGGDLAAKLAELADSLGNQQRRTAALERALADLATQEQPSVDPGRVQALADALATLKGDDARFAAETRALEDRLSRLEAQASRNAKVDAARAALVLAVVQLAAAVSGSAPYAQQLAGVAALAQGDADLGPAITTLQAHAATGVPTPADLAAKFDGASVAAARAAIAPERSGWVGELLARLSRLVVIRRTGGDVAGEDADALLARAEARLKAGDLAGAVTELSTLEDGPAEAVKPWLADARGRMAVDAALASLTARATALLAQPPS